MHAGIDKTRLLAGVLETAAWRVGEGGLSRVVDRLLGRVGGRALRKSRAERRQGDLDQYGHCNNIVIEMKDYLLVVDANYPSGARALMADIKTISSKPVKFVFDTHHHGDHAYGNPLWTQAGATTFAYRGVAEEMRRYEPARWRAANFP